MWYFVVFQPSKCKKTHFQPQIWSIWPIFPNDSESLPKVCYIKRKNSEILSKLRNSESAGGSAAKVAELKRATCSLHMRKRNCETMFPDLEWNSQYRYHDEKSRGLQTFCPHPFILCHNTRYVILILRCFIDGVDIISMLRTWSKMLQRWRRKNREMWREPRLQNLLHPLQWK